jgi:Ca2+-binding RTX toxin-like protein
VGDSIDGDAGFDRLELLGSDQFYDFSFIGISEVEGLLFNTSGTGLKVEAQFIASQFGGAGIANTLSVVGDAFPNQISVFMLAGGSFSAADWTFANWGADDLIGIGGSLSGDTITGSSQADFIYGSSGADVLSGGGGDDVFGFTQGDVIAGESIDGDAGADALGVQDFGTVDFRVATISEVEGLVFQGSGLTTAAFDSSQFGGAGIANTLSVIGDAFQNRITVSTATGGSFSAAGWTFTNWTPLADRITLFGSTGAETLTGSSQGDVITGGGGNDTLDGGAGNDGMSGGTGNDTYFVDNVFDVITENPNEGNDVVDSTIGYTLSANVEALVLVAGAGTINGAGNNAANFLAGNESNNALDGLGGDDTMVGGLGDDTYVIDSTSDLVTENVGEGNDVVHTMVDYTIGPNIESVILVGVGNINAAGSSTANALVGNAGNNTLDGKGGDDTMIGGAGNDIYFIDSTSDLVVENVGEGNDIVHSSVDYTIGPNIESVILDGTGNINAAGSSTANALVGNAGNNTLDGKGGDDTMIGGAGNDIYFVDSTSDLVMESPNEGNDIVYASIDFTIGANAESLVLVEGAGNINGSGSNVDNALVGNSGNNVLDGKGAHDLLTGNGGNDTFVFAAGEANGDVIVDFNGNGVGLGDQLSFVGFGSGASFTPQDATHWVLTYNGGANIEVITFQNAAAIHASDFQFL